MHTRDDLPNDARLMRDVDELRENARRDLAHAGERAEGENRHTRRLRKALERRAAR